MYIEHGYIECGYVLEEPYILEGFIEYGYVEGDGFIYVEYGYIIDGYLEECATAATPLSSVDISFIFSYIFFPAQTLESKTLSYLYDNQTSLEPLRIVRAKNNP